MRLLNIAGFRECTESEGPGKRFALWCQGCLKRCPGCCNPEMQSIEPVHVIPVSQVEMMIAASKERNGIEGVSFIGGEPFLQSESLAELAQSVRGMGLNVLVFTGYTLEELEDMKIPGADDLMRYIDVLVDGAYVEAMQDTKRPWVGSTNQNVIRLTDAYPEGFEYMQARSMEILITGEHVKINGWPY
ncbi:MAG: radical SAM protein [Synergistaceae bacterium]|nr:radical SAM protein [Synergistaceae bacterium]